MPEEYRDFDPEFYRKTYQLLRQDRSRKGIVLTDYRNRTKDEIVAMHPAAGVVQLKVNETEKVIKNVDYLLEISEGNCLYIMEFGSGDRCLQATLFNNQDEE